MPPPLPTPPPPFPTPPSLVKSADIRANLIRELAIFFAGLGAILSVIGYLAITRMSHDQSWWGYPGNLAIGLPVAVLGGLHLISSVMLALLRAPWLAVVGAVAGTLAAGFYFLFMITGTGQIPASPMSAVIGFIPVMVWLRSYKLLTLSSNNSPQPPPIA